MNRIFRHMWVGDVALYAFDDQLAGHRAAAAVLDHVADVFYRGGFTDDALVELRATCFELIADDNRAIDGRTFFIAGDQKTD